MGWDEVILKSDFQKGHYDANTNQTVYDNGDFYIFIILIFLFTFSFIAKWRFGSSEVERVRVSNVLESPKSFKRVKVGPYILAKDITEIKQIEPLNKETRLVKVSNGGSTNAYIGILKQKKFDGFVCAYPKKVFCID
jgi:hypothetical protein